MKPVSTSLVLILLLALWHHETRHTDAASVAAPTKTSGSSVPASTATPPRPSHSAGGGGGGSSLALVTKGCTRALHKDFCVATLSTLPASKGAPDSLQAIAAAALTQLRANVTSIAEHIEKLLDSSSDSDGFAEECLADCAEGYSDAGDQIDDSLGALADKGYDDVLTWVSAAMADASSCEQGFKEEGGQKSPLTAMNDTFSKLCSSVLAVVNVLKAGA